MRLYDFIDRALIVLIVAVFAAFVASCGWFIYLGFDGSFQRYAQHMGW